MYWLSHQPYIVQHPIIQATQAQMMEILQNRHTDMEININTYTMCATNYLGMQLLLAIDPGGEY